MNFATTALAAAILSMSPSSPTETAATAHGLTMSEQMEIGQTIDAAATGSRKRRRFSGFKIRRTSVKPHRRPANNLTGNQNSATDKDDWERFCLATADPGPDFEACIGK